MVTEGKKVKISVNGGIGFGAKLNPKQLMTIAKYLTPIPLNIGSPQPTGQPV